MPHAAAWHVLALDGLFAIRGGLFLLAVGTAARLLMPGDSIGSTPGYSWFAARGGDLYWAAWSGFEAALHLWAMLDRRLPVRTWTAFASSALRCWVVYGLYQSNAQTLGIVPHGVLAYLALFLVFRNRASAPGDSPQQAVHPRA